MNLIRQFVIACATFSMIGQPALAVKVVNEPPQNSVYVSSTGLVERGGTVDAVDFGKKTIVVNKVKYVLATTPIKVHAPTRKSDDKAFQLKAGMQIRFNTSKANYAMQEQVLEIWVTGLGSKPVKK
ncbi:MAG: hypothetical protein WCG50_05005 [Rhodoferax sp.]|uniref:hypothetical protein n=1 Tax=Rhodoferax sp. TaxID=50421 RepID=UPI003015F717